MSSQIAVFDTIRFLNFTGISASYAVVQTPFTHPMRLVIITNNTNGDLFLSTDGVNNQIFVKAGTFKPFNICTNREETLKFFVPSNTQFYVKQSTAPSAGDVYIEAVYGYGE
jgi:hypothetical protein